MAKKHRDSNPVEFIEYVGLENTLPLRLPVLPISVGSIDDPIAQYSLGLQIKKLGKATLKELPRKQRVRASAVSTKTESHKAPARRSATEDPDVLKLHIEAQALYRKANATYRAIPGRTFSYIDIHSGRRTTQRQAELYEAFIASTYGGPPENAANQPGRSLHEYGLAIDITRGSDGAILQSALEDEDWVQVHDDEGWHFEAQGIASWSKLTKQIHDDVAPLAKEFANGLVAYFEFRKKVSENEPRFHSERARLAAEQGRLAALAPVLKERQADLKQRSDDLRAEALAIGNERDRLRDVSSRYNNVKFRCPNGKPYPECDHVDLKLRYERERKQLLDEYQRGTAALGPRQQRHSEQVAVWKQETTNYRSELNKYNIELAAFRSDSDANNKLAKRIADWQAKMATRLAEKKTNLEAVILAVGKVK